MKQQTYACCGSAECYNCEWRVEGADGHTIGTQIQDHATLVSAAKHHAREKSHKTWVKRTVFTVFYSDG